MLKAFDASTREECTAQRARSNTPLAALVLLNDPTFVEAARELALRSLTEKLDTDAARISFLFREVLARHPDEDESNILLYLLKRQRADFAGNAKGAADFLNIGLKKLPKGVNAPDLAAWTSVSPGAAESL